MSFISRKNLIKLLITLPVALAALLYGGGYVAQFLYNYNTWQDSGGSLYSGTAPQLPDPGFISCIVSAFRFPYGLYGLAVCVVGLALLILMVMKMGSGDSGEFDQSRNLTYSKKGTYGTAGFMTKQELKEVLDIFPNIKKHPGIILGEIEILR